MSKLAETTQYNKTKRRQGPPKPGSAAWAAAEKNPKIAQAGRAKRGDAGAILKAGQKRASYGGWKEKPGAMKRWQDAVTKRLTWEKRNNWDGNRQSVPSTMAFSFLAQQYAVDTKAIQGACEKAMARGKFAQYVEQKGAPGQPREEVAAEVDRMAQAVVEEMLQPELNNLERPQ